MPVNLVTLTIQDTDGDLSSVSVYVSQDLLDTVGELSTVYVEPLWDAIRPLITGVLIRAAVSVAIPIGDFTNNTPEVTSDIDEKVLFSFLPCDLNRAVRLSLPTVKETIFTALGAGKTIDPTNADVSTFSVLMTEDVGSGGINATDSHGSSLCRVETGISFFKG